MRFKKFGILLLVLFLLTGSSGFAQEEPAAAADTAAASEAPAEEKKESQWPARNHKLLRGFANILTSWMEVPAQIRIVTKETNWPNGLLAGLFSGVFLTAVRLGTGAYEVLSFAIPYPTPDYYQLIEPEYPWQVRERYGLNSAL